MRSTIKVKPEETKRVFPQLFENKKLGLVWLFSTKSDSTIVYADMSKSVYPFQTVGYYCRTALDPYDNARLDIFEGTIELTNP